MLTSARGAILGERVGSVFLEGTLVACPLFLQPSQEVRGPLRAGCLGQCSPGLTWTAVTEALCQMGKGREGRSWAHFGGKAGPTQLWKTGTPYAKESSFDQLNPGGEEVHPALWTTCLLICLPNNFLKTGLFIKCGKLLKSLPGGVNLWNNQISKLAFPSGINQFQWHPEKENSSQPPPQCLLTLYFIEKLVIQIDLPPPQLKGSKVPDLLKEDHEQKEGEATSNTGGCDGWKYLTWASKVGHPSPLTCAARGEIPLWSRSHRSDLVWSGCW